MTHYFSYPSVRELARAAGPAPEQKADATGAARAPTRQRELVRASVVRCPAQTPPVRAAEMRLLATGD
jgi:hypothetical protein